MKILTMHVPCARDSCTSYASENTDYLTINLLSSSKEGLVKVVLISKIVAGALIDNGSFFIRHVFII
jgi:hypothetical protein